MEWDKPNHKGILILLIIITMLLTNINMTTGKQLMLEPKYSLTYDYEASGLEQLYDIDILDNGEEYPIICLIQNQTKIDEFESGKTIYKDIEISKDKKSGVNIITKDNLTDFENKLSIKIDSKSVSLTGYLSSTTIKDNGIDTKQFCYIADAINEHYIKFGEHSATFIQNTTQVNWTVPSDWNNANNIIEVIGGGATGGSGSGSSGGGGGAYAKLSNVNLTSGINVTIQVGGTGADTYLCNATTNCATITGTAVNIGAKGTANITGGSSAQSVGGLKYGGGNGGTNNAPAGGGGGGAGGSNGTGGSGGSQTGGTNGGGGGGGNGGGSNGSSTSTNSGANGGNNVSGGGGGAGDAIGNGGGAGTFGGGGGGGGVISASGGIGGNGTEWNGTHGSGGGAGGAAYAGYGNIGGFYGGGGSSGYFSGGAGAQGIILITYTPSAVTDSCTYSGSGNWLINCLDNCTFTGNQTISSSNNVSLNGTGMLNFANGGHWFFSGSNQYINVGSGCQLNLARGGGFNF